MQDVIVVSAFARGDGLAVELQRQGLKVTLLDLTQGLGSGSLEDVEGPFGFFADDGISATQAEALAQLDPMQSLENGFVVWLSDGPIEFKGPTLRHRLQFHGNLQSQLNFWWGQSKRDRSGNLDVTKTFSLRELSRGRLQQSLEWARTQSVQVLEQVKILDGSLGSQLTSLEIQTKDSNRTDVIKAHQFIFCLSEDECLFLFPSLSEKLFRGLKNGGQQSVEAPWSWQRYRFELKKGPGREELPQTFLLLAEGPWTHEAAMIVRRSSAADYFHVWTLMATEQRFNTSYLKDLGDRLLVQLQKRLPQLQPQLVEYPAGFDSSRAQIGPMRQPVFEGDVFAAGRSGFLQVSKSNEEKPEAKTQAWVNRFGLQQVRKSSLRAVDGAALGARRLWRRNGPKNLIWNESKHRLGLGLNHELLWQREVVAKLKLWWMKEQEKRMKARPNDREVHPS